MEMNKKILSLPPYLSVAWKNVVSLQVEARSIGEVLIVELISGSKVEVPHLDCHKIHEIFKAHSHHMEEVEKREFSLPNLGGMSTILQHDLDQKDTPPLPPEMLEKIAIMTKPLLPLETASAVHVDPHCNCPHCQIMRAIFGNDRQTENTEEEVSNDDLKFSTWHIRQENKHLFSVTNPLDEKEHYSVFLGTPIGCTCGSKTCEHIEAVLKS